MGFIILVKMTEPSEYTCIDARNKPCPMPLLMLKRELKKSQGQHLFLLKASDPHSEIDILRYCQLHNISCEFNQISTHEFHFSIDIKNQFKPHSA